MTPEEINKSPKTMNFENQKAIRKYQITLIITLCIVALSLAYLVYFHAKTGDIMYKDVSLTGGAVFTVYTDKQVDNQQLEDAIRQSLPSLGEKDILIRRITEIQTGKQLAISLEAKIQTEDDVIKLKQTLSGFLGFEINDVNSSAEFTGSALGSSFYKEILNASLLAFIFMAIVVFIQFKSFIPSFAVILCAFTDIAITLAIVNMIGLPLSIGGVSAFLMLIGYSVDTDILLNTRLLKRREPGIEERHKSSIKTGLTETITSIACVLIGYFIVSSPILKEIFLVLSIGLFVDLFGTWLQNSSILRLYCYKKNIN
ncbi:hypothetical protein COS75_01495 [Candidatus Pacearchaeota archaeon CG06_land_8_20_14_3_00_35_12]|nr:MAG: hypothetical protein COS75_01495 [Candidatus Pacearchaeota archaeon CG06_land_8_20_14_3_00_35_12]